MKTKIDRTCMVAAFGSISDLLSGLGGFPLPSVTLKFTHMAVIIEAAHEIPTRSWLQILAVAGAIEAEETAVRGLGGSRLVHQLTSCENLGPAWV